MPFYKRFFEISFDVMCVVNKTHFLEVNDSMCNLLEYSREELISRPYLAFVHPEDVELTKQAPKQISGPNSYFENRYLTKSGKTVWLRWCAHKEVEDGVRHCVAKDVTEIKVISTQLGQYVINLQKSERAATAAKEEAEALAYAASHDLQEPLRTILNWASFLQDDYGKLLPDDGREQLRYIIESATRGRELVSDLLQLSRVGRNPKFGMVDMNYVVDKAVTDAEIQVRETKAEITRDDLPQVWGDASLLRLLVKNLLTNAMKFRKPGEPPRIHVGSGVADNAWLFNVRDEGIGMDEAYLQKVFGVFTRLNYNTPGTGIGLAICQKIAKLHEGNIWIESKPGAGATVLFTVSRANAGAAHDDQGETDSSRRGSPTGREDDGAPLPQDRDVASAPYRLGRLGGVAVLAAEGLLRDRPSRRSRPSGPQSAQGQWLRSAGRGTFR